VSHELRTPLAVICSAGENLADGVATTSEQTRRYGHLIQTQGRRLAGLVEQTLGFAGVQRGKIRFQQEPVEVETLVGEALAAAASEIRAAGAQVDTEIAPDLPLVEADPVWMMQALRNLIANATQYGGSWVGIRAREEAGMVAIAVADRGVGLTSSDRAHIFEPFFRGRAAADKNHQGAGLGLAIVKQVVEAHGGSVDVSSEPGNGATFTVRLPAAKMRGEESAPAGVREGAPSRDEGEA
jgi:signal transduction histidine kinase